MKEKTIVKWSVGIFTTVLTAVSIWYITNRLVPAKRTVDLNILEFNLRDNQLLKGEKAFAYFKIKNEGNASATGCVCILRDEKDSMLAVTREFFLEPDEVMADSLRMPELKAQRAKKLSLMVRCKEISHAFPEKDINIDVIACAEKLRLAGFKYTEFAFDRKFRAKITLSNPCKINLKETAIRCIVYKWNDTSSKVDVITTEPFQLEEGQSVKRQLAGSKRLNPGIYGYRITVSDKQHRRMDNYKTGQLIIKRDDDHLSKENTSVKLKK